VSEPIKIVSFGPPSGRRILLNIGVQSFRFEYTGTKEESDWYVRMLTKAFANAEVPIEVVTEED